jgi:hypothetical protein
VGWWLRLTTGCMHVAAACTRMRGIGCLMYEACAWHVLHVCSSWSRCH